jgi:hypothetical protein
VYESVYLTDEVVALLAWTVRIKSVVYIGWAAVSGSQSNLPSPLADSTSPAYRLPGKEELGHPVPKRFTHLGLMTVMIDLMEQGTCRYKKLKSPYIYLHVNPTESPTHISPAPFWTQHGFAPVDETLVIPPLPPLEAANPSLRSQHALTTTVHVTVLASLQSLRELQALSPWDGESSDTDEGIVVYYRAHTNPCPALLYVTHAARRTAQNEEMARQAEEA